MNAVAKPDDPASGPRRRRVGRPTTQESGGASLATVLDYVRRGEATTRQDIERAAELSRAVVADRLATLTRLGLVGPGDLGPAVGGRAPRHMRFCAEVGAFLVASVDRASLAVALADLSGALLVEHHEAVDLAVGPEAILERLTTLFIWLLDERGGRERAWGLALAMPEAALAAGAESDAFGVNSLSLLQAWRNFDFAEELSLRFGAPCWVRSLTQMMTLGELKAGAGQGVSDLLCVRLDRSISAGVVSQGRLHRGAQQAAGLIGHAATGEGEDRICPCGAKGCLDVVASGDAVARDALAAAREGRSRYLADMWERNDEVTANDVSHGAQLGDAVSAELLARSGRLIGESLAPLVNLFNPAVVVLAGSLAHSGEILLAAVREAVYRRSHPLVTRDLRIVRSQLGGSAELIGAGHTVVETLFAPGEAREWIVHGSPRRSPALQTALAQAKARRRKTPAQPAVPPRVA